MSFPPFSSWSITLWLAMTAIVLFITIQLYSAYDGPATLLVDSKKLKYSALVVTLFFVAAIAIRIYEIFVSI